MPVWWFLLEPLGHWWPCGDCGSKVEVVALITMSLVVFKAEGPGFDISPSERDKGENYETSVPKVSYAP